MCCHCLKKEMIFELLPETREIARYFPKESEWNLRMQTHNQALRRGERMCHGLGFRVKSLLCPALNVFMLQIHSKAIAKALNSVTKFGERVVEQIQQDPSAPAWWLHRDLLIQGRHWMSLCGEVMHIVQLTGLADPGGNMSPSTPDIDRWPDRDALEVAARSAASIFGPFQAPFSDCPPDAAASASAAVAASAAGRLWAHAARDDPAAAADPSAVIFD